MFFFLKFNFRAVYRDKMSYSRNIYNIYICMYHFIRVVFSFQFKGNTNILKFFFLLLFTVQSCNIIYYYPCRDNCPCRVRYNFDNFRTDTACLTLNILFYFHTPTIVFYG